ncbi:MAG: hypothetical protein R3F07_19675 [Opitutaceae bacterium]
MNSKAIIFFLASLFVCSSGLRGQRSSIKTLLERLDDIPAGDQGALPFYLIGCLRAAIEDMIFYSLNLPVGWEIAERDSELIRSNFDSAASVCLDVIQRLKEARDGGNSLEHPEMWKRVSACITLSESIGEEDYAIDLLLRARESTIWAGLDGLSFQYLSCGYGLEKSTRALRLLGLQLSTEAHEDSPLARILELRMSQYQQAILASWLCVIEIGELDEFLQFGIDGAADSYTHLFGRTFPAAWPVGESGFFN